MQQTWFGPSHGHSARRPPKFLSVAVIVSVLTIAATASAGNCQSPTLADEATAVITMSVASGSGIITVTTTNDMGLVVTMLDNDADADFVFTFFLIETADFLPNVATLHGAKGQCADGWVGWVDAPLLTGRLGGPPLAEIGEALSAENVAVPIAVMAVASNQPSSAVTRSQHLSQALRTKAQTSISAMRLFGGVLAYAVVGSFAR